jgi:chromosome segregation ATPase
MFLSTTQIIQVTFVSLIAAIVFCYSDWIDLLLLCSTLMVVYIINLIFNIGFHSIQNKIIDLNDIIEAREETIEELKNNVILSNENNKKMANVIEEKKTKVENLVLKLNKTSTQYELLEKTINKLENISKFKTKKIEELENVIEDLQDIISDRDNAINELLVENNKKKKSSKTK